MTGYTHGDEVEIFVGGRLIEGTIDRIEARPGLTGLEDRIHVDAGESTIIVSEDQLHNC